MLVILHIYNLSQTLGLMQLYASVLTFPVFQV